mgnify:CR=1 FL=1|tara:strand:- start:128 stop:604 length:477 start_codon:yes stop_codon:yes gene_type:complete
MQCPSCQNTDSRVLESRAADAGKSVRRRRECLNCEFRFTTYERVENSPITVLKRNGNSEVFNRNKIINGLQKACEKTSISLQKIELIAEDIEGLLQKTNSRDVSTKEIGELVLKRLQSINEVAYIRFASVHREFHGINDFVATLERIKSKNNQLARVI